jgi:hypothetical protein
MSYFLTEMAATGHVYVRPVTLRDASVLLDMSRESHSPGTRSAIGCWSIYRAVKHEHVDCTCDDTFICSRCVSVCGYCLGCDDDDQTLCNECWMEKHYPDVKVGSGARKAFRKYNP